MAQFSFKQAKRRYRLVFWPLMVDYAITCIGGAFLQRQFDDNPLWLASGLAIMTTFRIFAALARIWRYSMETDEFSRMMQLEALAIGGLFTAGATGLVGFLRIYEAIPTFPALLLLPVFFVSYGTAKWVRGQEACV